MKHLPPTYETHGDIFYHKGASNTLYQSHNLKTIQVREWVGVGGVEKASFVQIATKGRYAKKTIESMVTECKC